VVFRFKVHELSRLSIYVDKDMRKEYLRAVKYYKKLLNAVLEVNYLYNLKGKWV